MMRKFVLVFLFFFIKLMAFGQPLDCSYFKEGNYTYLDSAHNKILVKRGKRKQQEINSITNEKLVLRISWIGSCTYELIQIWANSKKARKMNGSKTKVVISKILDDDTYEYTCGCDDPAINSIKGIMTKIF